jgi:hypothetical protein
VVELGTGQGAHAAEAPWNRLLREILEGSSDRIVERLVDDKNRGQQTSKEVRAIFDSFSCPAEYQTKHAGDEETVDLIRQVRWLDFDYDSPTSQGYAKADPRMSATSETPDSSYVRYQATQMVARRRCLAEEHLMGRLLCQLAKIDQRQVCAVAVPQWKSRNLAWPFSRKFPKGTRQFLRDPNFFPLFHERQHDTGPVCTKTTLMLIVIAVEIGT